MRAGLRYWTALLIVTYCISPVLAQTSTYCHEAGFGVRCTTTPTPKSGWEQLNDTLDQMRRDREERQRQKQLQELEKRRADEEAAAAARHQVFQQKLEHLRREGERLVQQQENQQKAAEALNMTVSQAVIEHRCEDAKTIALTAGNLELADKAMRLCTPSRAGPKAHPAGIRKRGGVAPVRPLVAAQVQLSADRQPRAAPHSEPKIQTPKPNSRVKQPLVQSFVVTRPEPSGPFPRGPEPANDPGTWITSADYPPMALALKVSGSTLFQLTISTKGKVLYCSILVSSGSQGLDKNTCDLIKLRSGFFPARDAKGRPTIGTYKNGVNWTI
jgi:TonB family protein